MDKKVELLAPGGSVETVKAAILAGADAIYCGLDKFNARNRAANISFDNLLGIIRVAHEHNCQVFLTLNILLLDSEIPSLFTLLNKLQHTSIDGLIVQDIGLAYLLNQYFPTFDIHASTQFTTHNSGQISFLKALNASRVNLSRELNLQEIKQLSDVAHSNDMLTEVFVHGSNCISFSGACYFSSVHGGNSGNRGRCSQPCRDKYNTENGTSYPFNLKDNAAIFHIDDLLDAGADSLKIEGRIKKADYVYTVVDTYKKRLNKTISLADAKENLYQVFNRDFTTSFLTGEKGKSMFIDSSRDYSLKYLHQANTYKTEADKEKVELEFYQSKDEAKKSIEEKISSLNFSKLPLNISLSGSVGQPLVFSCELNNRTFTFTSSEVLMAKGSDELSDSLLRSRLKSIEETEYTLNNIDLSNLAEKVYIPFKSLNAFKKELLFFITGSSQITSQVVPKLKGFQSNIQQPQLSVLINNIEDYYPIENVVYYYDMPSAIHHSIDKLIALFEEHKSIIPYFPSVLIGEDYESALLFLDRIRPNKIVTNNSGIAFAAKQRGIDWNAGPYFNVVNSYSLLALKENFGCSGAFLSNEMNRQQIRQIKCPVDFELSFSIFHPILLMTSRQCLLQELANCPLQVTNDKCLSSCNKSAVITNDNNKKIEIKKVPGHHHRVYSQQLYFNPKVINDCNTQFGNFMIDLSSLPKNIEVKTQDLITQFSLLLKNEESDLENTIHKVGDVTMHQYKVGL